MSPFHSQGTRKKKKEGNNKSRRPKKPIRPVGFQAIFFTERSFSFLVPRVRVLCRNTSHYVGEVKASLESAYNCHKEGENNAYITAGERLVTGDLLVDTHVCMGESFALQNEYGSWREYSYLSL